MPDRRARLFSAAMLLATFCLGEQDGMARPRANPRAEMTRYMAVLHDQSAFSGVALVARGDRVVFHGAVGAANVELGVKLALDSSFRIGSLTKPLTATAVMKLEERGKLSLDDRVCSHLQECPPAWSRITIRQLLTHTAGIVSFTSLADYPTFMKVRTTPAGLLARVKDLPLEFEPGQGFKYSNSGYLVLGILIEKLSGMQYARYLEEIIFRPLGMRGTGYDYEANILPGRAAGYTFHGDRLVNAQYIDMTVPYAAGGLRSTASDLFRFSRALFAHGLLNPRALSVMLTPQRNGYSCGWRIDEQKGYRVIWHNGGVEGFSSYFIYVPESDLTVVVLSNQESGAAEEAARALSHMALGEPYDAPERLVAVPVPTEVLRGYVGSYELDGRVPVAVTLADNRLLVRVAGQEAFEAVPRSPARFFLKQVKVELQFRRSAGGFDLIIIQDGKEHLGKRRAD